jgi:two-component system sensor histidine kinase YesM
MIFAGVVTVMTIAFLISTFLIIRKEERDFAAREAEGRLIGLTGNIETSFEAYMAVSRLIMMDGDLSKLLRADINAVGSGMVNDAKFAIQRILNVTTGVECVYVFRKDGLYVCTKGSLFKLDDILLPEEEWPEEVLALRGRPIEYVNGSGALKKITDSPYVSIERAVYDINSQKLTGYMVMMISSSVIDKSLADYREEEICVMGLDGTYLAGNRHLQALFRPYFNSQEVTHIARLYHGRPVLVSGKRVGDMPLIVLSVSPAQGMYIAKQTIIILFVLGGLILISFAIIGRYVAVNITRPVAKLTEAMDIGSNADDLVLITDDMPNNEVGRLKDSFNYMITRIRELIKELINKEQSIQRAEMRVLQEQIKPHFLYNTIGTINALAVENGSEEVSSALETMGRFYRNFLSKGDREISLEREVTIVRDYLALQKLRYGDILSDEYDLQPEALKCYVPKLILQPLVENSIYHGIRQKGEPGVIKISAHLEGIKLHIKVRDTGVGMSKEDAENLISGKKTKTGEENSFGLWGTIERVRYYSHRDDVVKIDSKEGEYTEIEFIIPVVSETRED